MNAMDSVHPVIQLVSEYVRAETLGLPQWSQYCLTQEGWGHLLGENRCPVQGPTTCEVWRGRGLGPEPWPRGLACPPLLQPSALCPETPDSASSPCSHSFCLPASSFPPHLCPSYSPRVFIFPFSCSAGAGRYLP